MRAKATGTRSRSDVTLGSFNRVDRISAFTLATIWEGITSELHMHIDTTHTQIGRKKLKVVIFTIFS